MRYPFERFAESLEVIVRPVRYVRLDDETLRALRELIANDAGRNPRIGVKPEEVRSLAEDMIRFGLQYQWTALENLRAWRELTPRQQDVTACICLGYTNQKIARTLTISYSTVKTHIRNVLDKFKVNGKLELKGVLKDWDFNNWIFEKDLEKDH